MRPSSKLLRDRVDVLDRSQLVADGQIEGRLGRPLYLGVACAILADGRAQAFAPLLGLGGFDLPSIIGVFLGTPEIAAGWALRHRFRRKTVVYNVRSVTHYPNEARSEYQVAVLVKDTSSAAQAIAGATA